MELTLQSIVGRKPFLLEELSRRQAIVRDKVRSVRERYATGLYLFGSPGTAKTHTVRKVLDGGEPYVYQRGHLTPVGLFELLAEHPDEVIVLDDLGAVLDSQVALQILLTALEAPKNADRSRVVRYRNHREERRVAFRGGIVCVSNRVLHDAELLGAFKSRVHTLNYEPSPAQLGALMLDIADRGWPAEGRQLVPATELRAVAEYLISEILRLGVRFDIRLFVDKAIPDYVQWADGETESDWRDLLSASIEEQLVEVRHAHEARSREERKRGEQSIVREIVAEHSERDAQVAEWVKRTNKSSRAFYRRLAEIG